MEPSTSVLLDRAHEPAGLNRMLSVSGLVHVAIIATLAAMPEEWRAGRSRPPATVMTISLGGAPGPDAGGMNQLGGRPIQQVVPLPELRRPEPVRPPAAKPPEMTLPDSRRTVTQKPVPKPPVRSAPEDARGRAPTKGAEVRPGDAVAQTGSQGLGFGGLSSGGGGGSGGYLDVGDFCCPEYLFTMQDLIRRRWDNRQALPGQALVKFTIQRDGLITDVELERSSGYAALDLAARRALELTRQLPPLPTAYDQPYLTVHLRFEYRR